MCEYPILTKFSIATSRHDSSSKINRRIIRFQKRKRNDGIWCSNTQVTQISTRVPSYVGPLGYKVCMQQRPWQKPSNRTIQMVSACSKVRKTAISSATPCFVHVGTYSDLIAPRHKIEMSMIRQEEPKL